MRKIYISEVLETAPILHCDDSEEDLIYILRNCIYDDTKIVEDIAVRDWYVLGKDLIVIDY